MKIGGAAETVAPDGGTTVVIVSGACCFPPLRALDVEARRVVDAAIARSGVPARIVEMSSSQAYYGGLPRALAEEGRRMRDEVGISMFPAVGFVGWELRTRAPMLDVRLFASRRFGGANLALTVASFALVGCLFFLTQYLQFVLGYTPIQAGFALVPEVVGLMIGAALATRLQVRLGARSPVAAGLAIVAGALWWFSLAGVDSPYLVVGVVAVVVGLGFGLAYVPATDSVMGSLPRERAGVGSATNDTTRQVGGALGVAVLGSILASGYRDAIAGSLPGLPDAVATAVRDSLGAAVALSDQIGGGAGEALLDAGRSSFMDGVSGALVAGALVMAVAAVASMALLPAAAPEPEAEASPMVGIDEAIA